MRVRAPRAPQSRRQSVCVLFSADKRDGQTEWEYANRSHSGTGGNIADSTRFMQRPELKFVDRNLTEEVDDFDDVAGPVAIEPGL